MNRSPALLTCISRRGRTCAMDLTPKTHRFQQWRRQGKRNLAALIERRSGVYKSVQNNGIRNKASLPQPADRREADSTGVEIKLLFRVAVILCSFSLQCPGRMFRLEWQLFEMGASDFIPCPLETLLVTSVSSKVRKCAAPSDHLRSEISFSCTCNIPDLIPYIQYIA